jgi:hypothetical protein
VYDQYTIKCDLGDTQQKLILPGGFFSLRLVTSTYLGIPAYKSIWFFPGMNELATPSLPLTPQFSSLALALFS